MVFGPIVYLAVLTVGEGTEDLLDYTYRAGQSHLSTISFPFLVLTPIPPAFKNSGPRVLEA